MILSSSSHITQTSTQALVKICKKLGGTTYISGTGGKNYLNIDFFEKENIKVEFQEYKHPTHKQVFKGFEPWVSALDLLFNEGPALVKPSNS